MEESIQWYNENIPRYKVLTDSSIRILENILRSNDVDYLAVSGRVKDESSFFEKVKRKGYTSIVDQMTDISGIRIIVYLESDVKKVAKLIEENFTIDKENSLDKDTLLSTDQIGYRSVHYVAELGEKRNGLPEYDGISNLKFECQIRTVLQHAWAELSHDRQYKFSDKLPPHLERELYLFSGMLEIADKGFDRLSIDIEDYVEDVSRKEVEGDLNIDLNSLSLRAFMRKWCADNTVTLLRLEFSKDIYSEVLVELENMGITNLKELSEIIPDDYASNLKKLDHESTVFGVIRNWMIIHFKASFFKVNDVKWVLNKSVILEEYLKGAVLEEVYNKGRAIDSMSPKEFIKLDIEDFED